MRQCLRSHPCYAKVGMTFGAVAGGALLVVALTAGSAMAAPPVTPGSRYLALGDSATFGYEEPNVVPAPNYHDAASFQAYPEQLGARLRLKVANAACPGETSASFINPAAPNYGCERLPPNNIFGLPAGSPGYRKFYPLHVDYRGSQLHYAVRYLRKHRGTRLVSLMIGANEFTLCAFSATSDHCASASEQSAVLAKVRHNLHRILETLRRKARYRGQLAIVNYYPPFSLASSYAYLNGAIRRLNHAVDQTAGPFQVVIAHGYREFQRAALHSGGDPCKAGLLTQLNGQVGNCGVHPSYAGQALLSQALEKAIKP
jgi:lysophospholipase L1-like esterase